MLHATYKASPYIFYISTEDRRYNTTVPTSQIRFLFKFTNDMDGRVVYAYGQDQVVYDRYTKVTLLHNTTEDIFLGRVNFVPNGYWNYVVYEVSSLSSIASLTCETAPQTANGDTPSGADTGNIGYYTLANPSGAITSTVQLTGKNDIYEKLFSDIDVAGSYLVTLYNGCGVQVDVGAWNIITQVAQADNSRPAYIDNFKQTSTGITFDVVSNMPIGHSYDFYDNSSLSYVQITNITSKPQTTSHTFTSPAPFTVDASLLEMEGWDQTGGSAGGGAKAFDNINIFRIPRSKYYGISQSLYYNPISVNSGGTILLKGDAMYTVINGTVTESTTQGFYTLQGVVEEGKLYIKEPVGEEQVQYTKYEAPASTNTIYYGQ